MIDEKAITDFIYLEAELLDTMQWQAWLDLFHPEGRYWMPLEWQQQDPVLQPSLMYEDLLLLKVRVERLAGERTFSQKPKSRCHHLLQAPRIVAPATRLRASTRRGRPISTPRPAVICWSAIRDGRRTNS